MLFGIIVEGTNLALKFDDRRSSIETLWHATRMTRKLKTYQTSLGFYDLAIAAPSMKAALEAWGAGRRGSTRHSEHRQAAEPVRHQVKANTTRRSLGTKPQLLAPAGC